MHFNILTDLRFNINVSVFQWNVIIHKLRYILSLREKFRNTFFFIEQKKCTGFVPDHGPAKGVHRSARH